MSGSQPASATIGCRTDVVVVGKQSPHWKAEKKGQKLLDVDRERELGHRIAMITEQRLRELAAAPPSLA